MKNLIAVLSLFLHGRYCDQRGWRDYRDGECGRWGVVRQSDNVHCQIADYL